MPTARCFEHHTVRRLYQTLDIKRVHDQFNKWWCDRKEHYRKLNVWFVVVTVLTMRSASGGMGCHVIWYIFISFLPVISKFLTNYHAIICPWTVIFTKVQSSDMQSMRQTHIFCWSHSVWTARPVFWPMNYILSLHRLNLRNLIFKNNTYVFAIVPLSYLTSISCHFPFITLKQPTRPHPRTQQSRSGKWQTNVVR